MNRTAPPGITMQFAATMRDVLLLRILRVGLTRVWRQISLSVPKFVPQRIRRGSSSSTVARNRVAARRSPLPLSATIPRLCIGGRGCVIVCGHWVFGDRRHSRDGLRRRIANQSRHPASIENGGVVGRAIKVMRRTETCCWLGDPTLLGKQRGQCEKCDVRKSRPCFADYAANPFVAAHFGLVCRRVARRAHGRIAAIRAIPLPLRRYDRRWRRLAAPVQSKPSDHSEPRWVFTPSVCLKHRGFTRPADASPVPPSISTPTASFRARRHASAQMSGRASADACSISG